MAVEKLSVALSCYELCVSSDRVVDTHDEGDSQLLRKNRKPSPRFTSKQLPPMLETAVLTTVSIGLLSLIR